MTQDEALELYICDPTSGVFIHRISHGRATAGEVVGWIDEKGYHRTKYRGRTYFVHLLIWLYVNGCIPDEIDHWDGNPGNNAISNLRIATRSQNLANARIKIGESGLRGVKLNPRTMKWEARIYHGRRCNFLGEFNTKEEAGEAYRIAADALYGEFAIHNRAPKPKPSWRRI